MPENTNFAVINRSTGALIVRGLNQAQATAEARIANDRYRKLTGRNARPYTIRKLEA